MLIDLQGGFISPTESDLILSQLGKILALRNSDQITVAETGKRVRRAAWAIAEDLHLDGFALGSGSDDSFIESLPLMVPTP